MPQSQTSANQTSDAGLAGQIDALLASMKDSAATLSAEAPGEPGAAAPNGVADTGAAQRQSPQATSPGLNPSEVESLAAQIDALVDEVAASAGTARTNEAEGQGPSPAARAESPTAEAHEELRTVRAVGSGAQDRADNGDGSEAESANDPAAASGGESGGRDLASPASPAGPSIDLGSLDAELAAQADGRAVEAGPVAPVVAAVLPAVSVPDAPAAASAEHAAGEGAMRVVEAVSTGPTASTRAGVSARGRAAGTMRGVLGLVGPAARWSLGLSARTLESSPKLARQTAGWIGLVTVFFGGCMWATILFFRTTPVPEVYGVASDVLEHGEPTPQPRPRPHPAAAEGEGGGHGAPAAAGGHGAPPAASGHGAPPAAAGHGTPPAASGHAKPAASGGHGGGH